MPMDESNVGNEYQNTFGPPTWVTQPTTDSAEKGTVGFLAPLTLSPTEDDVANGDNVEQLLLGTIMSALAAIDRDPCQEDALLAPVQLQPQVLSLPRLDAAAATCPSSSKLISLITAGASGLHICYHTTNTAML